MKGTGTATSLQSPDLPDTAPALAFSTWNKAIDCGFIWIYASWNYVRLLWIKYELHIATEALLSAVQHLLFSSAWHLLQNFISLQQHSLARIINFQVALKSCINLTWAKKIIIIYSWMYKMHQWFAEAKYCHDYPFM